jgi:hypothetical protein
MSKKFEQLLDYLVNEEMEKANELFHEIVVEKSREIYENMIAEEVEDDDNPDRYNDSELSESDEPFDMDDIEDLDDETSMSIGGENDPGDSLPADIEDPDAGDEELSSGEEQILDILSQLKSEFENIVSKNGNDVGTSDFDDEESDDFDDEESDDFDDEESDDFDDEESDDEEKQESMGQPMREYVEAVGMNWEKNVMKTPGPVGSGKGDLAGQTSVDGGKSPISSGKGKPTTGATASNILGDKKTGAGTNTGTSPAKADMGVVKTGGKFVGSGTHNVDNVKSGVKTLNKVTGGHGPEKKGSGPGPVGAGTGDKAGQTSVGKVVSPLNGAPNRNA